MHHLLELASTRELMPYICDRILKNRTFDIIIFHLDCNTGLISIVKSITHRYLELLVKYWKYLEVCVCSKWNSKCSNMAILFISRMTTWSVFQNQVTTNH